MNITRMSYPQYRKARRLTHECCNYCNGNCLLLDDGEECVCVQSISYSLLCRWFKVAVPNTARIVRCRYAGRKRRNASGKDTSCLRI